MKNLVFMCVLLLSGTSIAIQAEEIDFYVDQGHEDWAFKVTGKGRALVGKSLVHVKLDNLSVTNNPKHKKVKYIERISIGFGYVQEDGKWNVRDVNNGDWSVKRNLAPGEVIIFADHQATLDVKNQSLADFWIVVVVETTNRSTVYAHSRRDLFK